MYQPTIRTPTSFEPSPKRRFRAFLLPIGVALLLVPILLRVREHDTVAPGARDQQTFVVNAPDLPALVDIVYLGDQSTSFSDDINNVVAQLPSTFAEISGQTDAHFGLAGFIDGNTVENAQYYTHVVLQPYDPSFAGEVQKLTPEPEPTNRDQPEMSIVALSLVLESFQFRTDASKIVILSTDDVGKVFPPDYSVEAVARRYVQAGVRIVALLPSRGAGLTDEMMDQFGTLTEQTGGSIETLGSTSANLEQAIVQGLRRLPFEATPRLRTCPPLDTIKFDPPTLVGESDGSAYPLVADYVVSNDAEPGRWSCVVEAGGNELPFEVAVSSDD